MIFRDSGDPAARHDGLLGRAELRVAEVQQAPAARAEADPGQEQVYPEAGPGEQAED